jgi:peptide/nickel transport system permease protein
MILPVAVLAVYPISLVARQTRASVTEVLLEQYVTAARAAGIRERTILFRLALKNAIVPTLNVLGLTFAASLTGTVLIEIVFAWPGIGRYVTVSITAADFPAVIAVTIVGAIAYVGINLAVDIVQAAIDPRIRLT